MFCRDYCYCCTSICPCGEYTDPLILKNDEIIATQQRLQQEQLTLIKQQNEILLEQHKAANDEKETDDPVNEQSLKYGMLEFFIQYNFTKKTLVLKILKATHLPIKDIGGSSDPYVKVSLLPDAATSLCTEVKHKNCSPKWNETLEFEDYPYDKLMEMTLFVQVIDYDRFSKDDPIGELKIPLPKFDLENGQKLWKNLCYPHGKTLGRLGDILLDLSYDCPLLRLGVVRAKNLKALDLNGTSDPYVKVWLLYDGVKQHQQKTATKFNTLNPIFNQSMDFHVPIDKIRNASLEVTVMDYDTFGRDEAIGKIVLGSKTTPEQLRHWNAMFESPKETTSKWHVLRQYE